jgi:uncharacterized protein
MKPGGWIMRLTKWLFLLALMLLSIGVAAAQDEITLTPFSDDAFGIQGVLPEGWTKAGPGLHVRGQSATDPALIAQQTVAAPLAAVTASILPQLQLAELPESVGTLETDSFSWTLYKADVTAGGVTVSVDLALTEQDGNSYVVLMQALPEEYDALHEAVFLPVLEAYAPMAEATPDPSLPYTAEEVTFDNGDVTLAGTLTLPEGDGPHPAVVLITGSGPQDRDESLLPGAEIKPFKLIADYLTRQGIAVLRYDDRGTAKSTGDFASATSEDFAADASAAIDYLLTRDEINPDEIGILGHSEGGLVAAILGASNPNIAFIVSMAGTAVNGRDVLLLQNEKLILAEGGTQEQVDNQIDFLTQAFELIDAGDMDAVNTLIYEEVLSQAEALPEDQRNALGDLETYAQTTTEQQGEFFTSDWMRFFLDYDPAIDWAKTTIPVLGVFGGKDVQVVAQQNAPALEAALDTAGNTDYEIVTLPTANHLFQDAETGGTSEYGTLPAEFVADFLPTVGDWILDHVTLPE